MGIQKGKWVDGRYVDGYGNEIIPPVSERPKGYKPPPWLINENGKTPKIVISITLMGVCQRSIIVHEE